MPDELQQFVASLLIDMGDWASPLWVLIGLGGMTLLLLLAAYPADARNPFRPVNTARRTSWLGSPTLFGGVACVFIFLLRSPGLSRLILNPDESGLIAGAQTLALDPRYWISVDNTTLGPLSTVSVMLPYLLSSTVSMSSLKLTGLSVWCISVVILYRGLAHLHGEFLARLGVLPLVACIAGFTYWDFVAYNGEHAAILLIAVALYCFSRLLTGSGRLPHAIGLGVLLGLVPYSKLQAAPGALALGITAIVLLVQRRRFLVAGLAMAGALVPSSILAVHLFLTGAFHHFWQSYIANNFLYAQEGFFSFTKDVSYWDRLASLPELLARTPEIRSFLFSQLLFVSVGAAAAGTLRRSSRIQSVYYSIASLPLLGMTVASIIAPGNHFAHYLLLLLIPMAFFSTNLAAETFGDSTPRRPLALPRWVCAVLLLAGAVPLLTAMHRGNVAIEQAAWNYEQGKRPGRAAEEILKTATSESRLAMWGFGLHLYVETGLAQGTKEAHTERQMNPTRQQGYYLQRYAADLLEFQPEFFAEVIALMKGPEGLFLHDIYGFENYPEVDRIVREHYRLIGVFEEKCQSCEITPAVPEEFIARIRLFALKKKRTRRKRVTGWIDGTAAQRFIRGCLANPSITA
jgi:hypothetical protein